MALDTLYGVLSSSTAAFVNKLAGNSTLTLTCQGEGDFWAPVLRGFESLEHLLRDLLGPIIGIFPFTTNDVKELTRKCADFTKISNAFERIAKYVQLFYDWVMDLYQRYYVGFPADIQKWVTLVDDVQKVAPSGSGFVTIRQSMAKSRCLRRHLWNLKDVGIRYKKRLETAGKDSFLLRVVNERMAKLESVISANSGVFAGAEGKEKPVVICFYGRPNQGKTVLTNPLCEDLFKVLDLDEYIPSQDRYTLSKTSLFFDQYYGQKVMDIQDFMQIRDPERRIHEIETIMSCGDESVAPLNVAECSAKGSVFFRSEFLFVSSNMDPNQMQGLMANVMEFPEALLRRMDFIVEVTLDDTKIYRPSTSDQVPDTVGGFDRSAMTFNVTGGCAGAKSSLGWYEFVQLVSQYYYQTRLHSEMMAASGDDARLVAIRNQLEASRLKLEIARSPFSAKEGEEKVSLSTEGLFEAPACNWFTLLLLVFLFVPQKLGWLIPYLRRRLSSFVFETDATATIKEAVQGVVRETIAEFTPQLCTLSADAGRSFTLGALSTPPVLEATAYAQNWRIVLDKYTSDLAQWYARMKTMAAAAFTAFAVSVATVLGYRWWTASKPVSVNVQAEMYTKPEEIRARRNARTVKKRAKVYEAEKAADTYQSRAYAAYGIRQPPAFRGFEVQGGNDCNMSLAQQKAIANLGRIKTPRCATCALGLYERVIAVPLHVFLDPYTDAVSYVSPNNVRYDFSMEQLRDEEVMVSEDTHLVFLNLKRVCNTMPEFCNIRSWLTPHEDVIPSGEGAMVTKRLVGQVAVPQVINAVNLHEVTELLMKDYGDPSRKGQIARDFTGYFYILYNAPSKPGDCGAPLIERRSPQAVIVGLHVAGDDGMCAAAPLTRELFDLVSDGFGSNGLPIPLHSEGIFPYTIPVDANGVDACGVIPDEVPRPWFPRKSKLRPTIFQRFSAPTTKPAQLAPFSREGVRVSPSTIAFEKNCSPSLCFPSHEISSAISEIAAYYAIGTPSQRRGTVWTLEQTVFGDPEKKIASMPSTGGIGYPHCLSMKRNQLFTLEPPFISDLFRQEVLSLEAQLRTTNVPVLVVDTLKDEKRPIPKVEAGKTRVFNVFPLAVNALAKMYFGDFLDYINSQWRTHPVSVGVSTDPVDWHFLAERICNKSNFIAGDVSGWDRVVPFEVMMAWVRQANIFYNDTNSDIRWHLGQSVFQPYHLFGDALYRLNRGMSSGTYLTATFNSLAMATSLHIVGKRCGVNALGSMLIFGDDHVVAHDQDSFTQQDVKKFFNDHFIEYTSADKKDVVEDFTQLLELRFLKRAFVERNGLYHCPMDVPELIEQLMWYRDSSTTRTESQQSLYQRMFDHLQMELVQHSPTLYEAISADIAAFAADKDCKLLNVPFDDRYKQLFCRDKNLGLMRDEDMFNGSKIALAVQGDVCDEEAPVGATTVADTLEHQHEIGLASFQELSIPVMAADTSYAAPVMSEAFELPSGLFEMATRPKLIKELTFNTSDMTAAPILRLDVMAALLGNANFVSKLANAAFLRFDLEIELRVIATKFHYGQLLVAWRPYYLAGLGNYAVRTTSVLVQYFGQGGLKGDNYSAYDTVWTASQQASHNISVTANTVLNLKIPWNMPFEKVPTPYLGIARWHPGVLDIYQLTPIGPTDIDRAQLAIFANFSNIRGWGYANSAKNKILKMPNVELDLPTIPAEMHPGWTIAFQSESVIPAAATLTTEGGEENTNSQPSVLRRILGTALDIFRVASTILSPYGTILNWLGLSRPQEQVQVKSMFSVTPNIVSSIGIDNSMTWAYNAALRLPVDQSQGLNLLIEKMGATSTYLGCNVTTTSAQLDNTFLVDPRISKLLPQTSSVATAQKFALTPAGWVIVGKFGMFRSHARVSIRFSSSAFIACRFSISVGYNSTIRDDDDCISFYPTKLVDVQGDVTVDVEIPYQRSAPWIDAQDGGALAYVRIKQLTSIVSPEATETRPIYYTVFASFPGLQVCEPRVATDGFSAYARVTALGVQQQIIKPTLPVQGDCDPFPAQGKVGTSLEWGANDVPSSLLHLAKRASAIAPEDGAWSPHNPIFPTQVVYKKWLYLSVRHPTYYHLVAEVFRFSRASLTFLGKAISLTAIGGSWTSGWWFGSSSKKNWKYASTSWPVSTDSYSWVTLPYYSHAQYLPTPIAACRPINSGGGWYIASPFTATEYGPPLATQTYYAEGLTGFLGGADDVMYQTFIGVPLQWWTHVEDI
nr:TPA_asm: hypothetical protein [Sphaeripse virus]